jgi:ribonucleoside-diphosphate reductase alpha chain
VDTIFKVAKLDKIIKRNGSLVDFSQSRIIAAISKASQATAQLNQAKINKLARQVTTKLEENFSSLHPPTVEQVQNLVENILITNGYPQIAKAYMLYRQNRARVREAKKFLGVVDDLKLSVNAIQVLRARYLLKDANNQIKETPSQLFNRVAKAVAEADKIYGKKSDSKKSQEEFARLMTELKFLPNSPTLMNAGTEIGQLSACFVLPVPDSIEGIFNGLKNMAIIHKSGGGTGFSFSHLRPKGDQVKTTAGVASGPVSFMRIYDTATEVIKQGGRRRGANMGILRIDHPDIIDFITAKETENSLSNFNISVAITDNFMKALSKNSYYPLVSPRTKKTVRKLKAREVFDLIISSAWRTGDPGLVFIDRINQANPTPKLGPIESTNPCGEQPLLANESCNLGSISLEKFVKNREVKWQELKSAVRTAVHFLDNVIEVSEFPLPEIAKITKANRKIGLGIMGFAEALIKLEIPYNSPKALEFAEQVMKFISQSAREKSEQLAEVRGPFPNFSDSIWQTRGYKKIRNATLTTIAPTGTISIIADTSSGIEPLFAVSFIRHVMEGTRLLETNKLFKETAKRLGFYSSELLEKVARTGSIQNINNIPKSVKKLFLTSFDIKPSWHVKIQAAFQKHVDNAVSKTVNLPNSASIEDVRNIYLLAYRLKCKGITIYRYGSKKNQVLNIESAKTANEHLRVESEYSGGCVAGECPF